MPPFTYSSEEDDDGDDIVIDGVVISPTDKSIPLVISPVRRPTSCWATRVSGILRTITPSIDARVTKLMNVQLDSPEHKYILLRNEPDVFTGRSCSVPWQEAIHGRGGQLVVRRTITEHYRIVAYTTAEYYGSVALERPLSYQRVVEVDAAQPDAAPRTYVRSLRMYKARSQALHGISACLWPGVTLPEQLPLVRESNVGCAAQ